MAGVLAASLLGVAVERLVVTDSKLIKAVLYDTRDALEANDLERALAHVAAEDTNTRERAREVLSQGEITELKITYLNIDINRLTSPPTAKAMMNVRGDGQGQARRDQRADRGREDQRGPAPRPGPNRLDHHRPRGDSRPAVRGRREPRGLSPRLSSRRWKRCPTAGINPAARWLESPLGSISGRRWRRPTGLAAAGLTAVPLATLTVPLAAAGLTAVPLATLTVPLAATGLTAVPLATLAVPLATLTAPLATLAAPLAALTATVTALAATLRLLIGPKGRRRPVRRRSLSSEILPRRIRHRPGAIRRGARAIGILPFAVGANPQAQAPGLHEVEVVGAIACTQADRVVAIAAFLVGVVVAEDGGRPRGSIARPVGRPAANACNVWGRKSSYRRPPRRRPAGRPAPGSKQVAVSWEFIICCQYEGDRRVVYSTAGGPARRLLLRCTFHHQELRLDRIVNVAVAGRQRRATGCCWPR